VERAIPGVDASRDELLPFVGPAASLPLWSVLARLPFDAARAVWVIVLLLASAVLVLASLRLALGSFGRADAGIALLFGALTGPLVSDVSLGQVALVSAAAVAVSFVALDRRSGWPIVTACIAALQPNLALPLAARLTDRRTIALLAFALVAFLAVSFALGGGPAGFIAYLRLLEEHGSGERFILIQYSIPAILATFGIARSAAGVAGDAFAFVAFAVATYAAFRFRSQPVIVAAIAVAVLPWAVPFFHEHDFVIELIPALILCAAADARVRLVAAAASICVFVDWLGIAQRPHAALQIVCLAFALACALIAFGNRSPRTTSPLAPILTCAIVAAIAVPLAGAFPAPTWPDMLGAFHAAPGLDASAVWAAEQRRAGLDALVPTWGVLRAIPLAGCAALAIAGLLAARSQRDRATRTV
jgi:hypothetical protein